MQGDRLCQHHQKSNRTIYKDALRPLCLIRPAPKNRTANHRLTDIVIDRYPSTHHYA